MKAKGVGGECVSRRGVVDAASLRFAPANGRGRVYGFIACFFVLYVCGGGPRVRCYLFYYKGTGEESLQYCHEGLVDDEKKKQKRQKKKKEGGRGVRWRGAGRERQATRSSLPSHIARSYTDFKSRGASTPNSPCHTNTHAGHTQDSPAHREEAVSRVGTGRGGERGGPVVGV